ncbi:MAG: hypothetical protein V3T14_10470 [Myxococcota bacterium]
MIDARGAPYEQGWEQGRAFEPEICAAVREMRAELGPPRWRRELKRTRRGLGLAAARFLPQHHERCSGIAAAAGVPVEAIDLLASRRRFGCAARIGGGLLQVDVPSPEAERLRLRRSVPDAGGFSSVELTDAPWAGSVAGLNGEGIAIACERDEPGDAPSVRLLVQELLLRVRDLPSAVEHARRRGSYLGGRWGLILLDAYGGAARVVSDGTGIRGEYAPILSSGRSGQLQLEPAKGEIVWRPDSGPRESTRV